MCLSEVDLVFLLIFLTSLYRQCHFSMKDPFCDAKS